MTAITGATALPAALAAALLAMASDPILVIEFASGDVLECNTALLQLLNIPFGVARRSQSPQIFALLLDQLDDKGALLHLIDAVRAAPQNPGSALLVLRDGRSYTCQMRPLSLSGQTLAHVWQLTPVTHPQDYVSALKSSQMEAKSKALQLQTVFNTMSDGVVVQNSAGQVIEYNLAALRILGISADELLGTTSTAARWVTIHEDGTDCPGPDHPAMRARLTGKHQPRQILGIQTPGRDPTWVSVDATPLFHVGQAQPYQVLVTFCDVTAARRARLELEASEQARTAERARSLAASRMSIVGEMAGGIAHEINNPLAIIAGKANQLRRVLQKTQPDATRVLDGLSIIEATSHRIAKIVRGLRTFAGTPGDEERTPTPVRKIVEETADLCAARFRSGDIDLRLVCNAECVVIGNAIELSQALMHLLLNAFDAVAGLNDKWVAVQVDAAGDDVLIGVTDSGNGIPPHVADKMMNPFFTTKPVGKGTGLGLSIAASVTQSHAGDLTYDSQSLHTRFVIRLPSSFA